MRKSDTPYIDGIIEKYTNKVKEFYPGLEFGRRMSSLYSSEEPTSCTFEFGFNSSNLSNTEYQAKNNFDLIHYSSNIQNIFEIINSGFLRLSNLSALNDPQELNFISRNLEMKFNEEQIETYKDNFFTASFCKVTNNKPDDFAMWRLYGGDGFGAAIIFEVINFKKQWSDFLLANVQYGESKSVERFKAFINFHNSFQAENNYPIQNFPIALSSLMALHKNKIWQYEKEVRLLTHYEFDKYTLKNAESHICDLKHSISKNGTHYKYVELPLYNGKEYNRLIEALKKSKNPDFLFNTFPIFKIKKILLGYRLNSEAVSNVWGLLPRLSENYKYSIRLEQSRLRQQMQ